MYYLQLLPRLHEVLQRRDENNPIELKLHDMANELHKVVTMYLEVFFLTIKKIYKTFKEFLLKNIFFFFRIH